MLDEAFKIKGGQKYYIAGGTNQVDLMKKNIHEAEVLVDLNTVLSNSIIEDAAGLKIGAAVKNNAIAKSDVVLRHYPLLSKAILAGASNQIRNMASIGGNLMQRTRCPYFYDVSLPCNKRAPGSGCGALLGDNYNAAVVGYSENCVAVHPSDFCVALVALNAEVKIQLPDGKEDVIPFSDFHRLPGDNPEKDTNLPEDAIIKSVLVQKNSFQNNCTYLKIRERSSFAFALVSVAAAIELDGNFY